MTKSNYKLTKEDFKQINRRSLFTFQLGWNYERMQGSGYLYTILPQLRKIYGDDTPELKEVMKTHTQFFNTSNFFNTIITGIDLAIEEKEGIAGKQTVSGLKTGLMGRTVCSNWGFNFRSFNSNYFWGASCQHGD